MNKITNQFDEIPDEIFREAIRKRKEYNLNKRKYMYEQAAIRVQNGLDKEKESATKSNVSKLIFDILTDHDEFIPQTATTMEIEMKHRNFKKFVKTAGVQSTKLSNTIGVRQFQLGLLLYISKNIKKFKPALFDPKLYTVKPSRDPKEKTLNAIETFRSLDIATLIENEHDEI